MRAKISIKLCAVALCTLLAVLLGGCAAYTVSAPTEEVPEDWGGYEPPAYPGPQEETRYIYEIRQAEVVFVEESEKEAWREGIERLLSNVLTPIYVTGGELMGYVAPYPERPALEPWCYAIALFDIDLDGTPEVLGRASGGSSGGGYYYVHDLLSGKYIGTLNGGGDDSWAVYFDREGGRVETMCEYGLRFGWSSQRYGVDRATLAENTFGRDKTVYESSYLDVEYNEIPVQTELSEEQKLSGIHASYVPAYTALSFSVNGQAADPQEYYNEYGYFADNYLRIEGSGIRCVEWTDVGDGTEDAQTRARLMADALIGSGQKFVREISK